MNDEAKPQHWFMLAAKKGNPISPALMIHYWHSLKNKRLSPYTLKDLFSNFETLLKDRSVDNAVKANIDRQLENHLVKDRTSTLRSANDITLYNMPITRLVQLLSTTDKKITPVSQQMKNNLKCFIQSNIYTSLDYLPKRIALLKAYYAALAGTPYKTRSSLEIKSEGNVISLSNTKSIIGIINDEIRKCEKQLLPPAFNPAYQPAIESSNNNNNSNNIYLNSVTNTTPTAPPVDIRIEVNPKAPSRLYPILNEEEQQQPHNIVNPPVFPMTASSTQTENLRNNNANKNNELEIRELEKRIAQLRLKTKQKTKQSQQNKKRPLPSG